MRLATLWGHVRASLRQMTGGWFGPYGLQDKALVDLFGGQPTATGLVVNEKSALTVSAVWACINLIAGTIGSLPLMHYRRVGDGEDKEPWRESRLYYLLHDAPNDEMSAATFTETMLQYVLLWGNAFAEIRRDARGGVAALWPIEPWRVQAKRDGARRLTYVIDGETELQPEEMLHIPGLTPDGLWGYSPIQKARESFGLLLAAEKFGGRFFGNGSHFGGLLIHPGRLSEPAQKLLRKSLEERAQGVDRAHQFIVLEEGMSYERLGIPPDDAQFLETRQFQLAEVARWFGVPPHMIGDVERSTSWGTGIEQQTIGFVTFTLRRWTVRVEHEMRRKLISPLERHLQTIEFVLDGLLRGDTAARTQYYTAAKTNGWMSTNDIRRKENMASIGAQGDIYLVPANMWPADKIPDPRAATPPPPAPAEDGGARERAALADSLAELQALGREIRRARGDEQLELTHILDSIHALPPPPPVPELPPPPAPVDLTPLLERFEADRTERGAMQARLAALLPHLRGLIETTAADLVRREADRARRAASSPEKLTEWAAEFYPRQADYAVKVLRDAVAMPALILGHPEDAEPRIRAWIAGCVEESQQALAALTAHAPDELRPAVEALTSRWAAERPAAFAESIVQEVLRG